MEGSTLDDVLGLNQEAILNRRLETMVQRKGLAMTCKQARQFIVHGHVAIDGRKVTYTKSENAYQTIIANKSMVKVEGSKGVRARLSTSAKNTTALLAVRGRTFNCR